MRMMRGVVLGLMLASLPAAAAEVYKWVDAGGRIHYGDQPQPGWKRVDVNAPPASNQAPGAAPAPVTTYGTVDRAACEQKRKDLESYEKATRLIERDGLGREREYSADERKQLIEMTKKQADDICSGRSTAPAASAQ